MAETREQFARAVLVALGAPPTDSNVQFMTAWMAREGTKAVNNPLATTQPYTGATNFNSVGVKNYPTFLAGVDATVQTLTHGYNGIVGALRSGDGNSAAHQSSDLLKWSGGGYSSIGASSGGGGDGGVLGTIGDFVAGITGSASGKTPDVIGGITGVPGLFGDIATGWVKDLALALLPVFLTLIFTVAGFAFLSMGVHRLTGHSPVTVFNKAKSGVETAALVAAL